MNCRHAVLSPPEKRLHPDGHTGKRHSAGASAYWPGKATCGGAVAAEAGAAAPRSGRAITRGPTRCISSSPQQAVRLNDTLPLMAAAYVGLDQAPSREQIDR